MNDIDKLRMYLEYSLNGWATTVDNMDLWLLVSKLTEKEKAILLEIIL